MHLRAGAAGLVARTARRQETRSGWVWPGKVVHPDLSCGAVPASSTRGTPSPTLPRIFADRSGRSRRTCRGSRSASTSRCSARQAHRLSIVRSMNHDDAAHLSTAHRLLTGHLAPTPNSDAAGPSPRDWPHLGALVSKLRPTPGAIPSAVNMPWTVMHPAAPGGKAPGQDAGWLGKAYDPFHVDGDPNASGFHVEGLGLPDGISPARLADRRALLKQLADAADLSGNGPAVLGRLPAEGARRPGLGRGARGLPDRSGRPEAPRPLRPAHPRSVPLAGPPPDRGGRRPGDGQLAQRRTELLGHSRRQFQLSSRTV